MKFITEMSRTVRCERMANGRLKYMLVSRKAPDSENDFCSYGIRIECSLFSTCDNTEIRHITTNPDHANELFDMVSRYMVTPLQLAAVTADFIGSKSAECL